MERIVLRNISKTFSIEDGATRGPALQRTIAVFSRKGPKIALRALQRISFRAYAGEVIGIIGENGSGKSTLLRILAGVVMPDTGVVQTNGRIVPAIHLEAGIRERLTLKENIRLLCAFLLLTARETAERVDLVINYAGLSDFAHTRWYQLSDGMRARAVFGTVVYAKPDILLLDEIFAVGDELFREKSLKTILEHAQMGTTIILAGHNLSLMEQHCTRVLWIDRGEVKMDGAGSEVVDAYRNRRIRPVPLNGDPGIVHGEIKRVPTS